MLILTRRVGESIVIGNSAERADNAVVTVLGVKGNHVRVGITASPNVAIHREEIYERIKEEQRQAGNADSVPPAVRSDVISA